MDISVGDERAFTHYTEFFIFTLQDLIRHKPDMEIEPLLSFCEKLEDFIYRKVLRDCGPISQDSVWMKDEAILRYQSTCQHTLEMVRARDDCDWRKLLEEAGTKGSSHSSDTSGVQTVYECIATGNFKGFHRRAGNSSHSSKAHSHSHSHSSSAGFAKPKSVPKTSANAKPKNTTSLTSNFRSKSKPSSKPKKGSSVPPASATLPISLPTQPTFKYNPATIQRDESEHNNMSLGLHFDDSLFGPGEDSMQSPGSAVSPRFNASAWTSGLNTTAGPSVSASATAVVTSSDSWQQAQAELDRVRLREQESRRQQRMAQEEAARRAEEAEMERAQRQQRLEEERERSRRELELQTQTVYLDAAGEERDELEDFMNLR